jgi:hypothetical protein
MGRMVLAVVSAMFLVLSGDYALDKPKRMT